MDRWRSMRPIERSGLLTCALVVLVFAGWAAGWAWLAVPSALGAFAIGSAGGGVDTRAAGDWRPFGPGSGG